MSLPLTVESVLGGGLLHRHVVAFTEEGFTTDILKGHIPDDDLEELGLSQVGISVFCMRIWTLAALGDDLFQEKIDGASSIDLLEQRATNKNMLMNLTNNSLKKIFKRMATRRVFLNAVECELKKQSAAVPTGPAGLGGSILHGRELLHLAHLKFLNP
ncbi:hypothetical protein CYMTET_54131 [Cymbomonas tetramitiformis]|uniref:SAM domain-containing protein n=1 Tax=Cymbomonas tetramitiformis TaxID=36881 RepID=A0AAE0ER20_9CHLO|nr:hypothetical protein CYMTET_54131 [Cymbomonas tetramitiformis]